MSLVKTEEELVDTSACTHVISAKSTTDNPISNNETPESGVVFFYGLHCTHAV